MDLNTVEKFLLLAQHPQKGRNISSDLHINYGIIGAILLELSLDGELVLDNNKLRPLQYIRI